MIILASPSEQQYKGDIYWYRVLSYDFSGAATLQINEGRALAVKGYLAEVAPKGRPFNRIDLTGTVIVQVGLDREQYPGEVNT